MHSHYRITPCGTACRMVLTGCLAAAGVAAIAGELPAGAQIPGAQIAIDAVAAPDLASAKGTVAVEGMGVPLAMDSLDRMRGGEDLVHNEINVRGEVRDTSAERVTTGTNAIAGGSFANASGITTVIQNSGTGVLIQNAMIVNVQFVGPGP